MMRIKKGLFLLIAVVLACSFAAAQVPTGRFVGKVADEQGSPFPGVSAAETGPRRGGPLRRRRREAASPAHR